MQISTASFYDRSSSMLSDLTAQADALQTQISTSRKLQSAADDPVAYQRLAGLKQGSADDEAYGANLTLAASFLQQSDTTLSAITVQLQQASELALQARNGTLNATDRQGIATALAGIAATLVSLGNTRDASGQPLFGGQSSDDAVTTNADGTHSVNATAAIAIPIGEGQSVQASESAARVFVSDSGDNIIDVISRLAAMLQAGGTVDAAAIDGIAAASTQVTTVRGSLGARASRVELETNRLQDVATDREASRASIDGFDYPGAIVDLQKLSTILSATQASFSKLSSLSLFDYLR